MHIAIIIPALNEEKSVGEVVRRAREGMSEYLKVRIVVSDNGSEDATEANARKAGAEVVTALPRGYGAACLVAIEYLDEWPDIIAFLDADGSSLPEELPLLVEPITEKRAELVLGVRKSSVGMTLPQRFGTALAVWLVNTRWQVEYSDMGPFRSITRSALNRLEMKDRTWGWTIEMQILAVLRGITTLELPVSWSHRLAGTSKISGTVIGVLRAGARILWTVGKYSFYRRLRGAISR